MTYKYFIAAVTALAISVTGLTAAPARASDDTAKIITGIAALAIVGAAISNSKKDDDYAYSRSYGHKPKYYGYSSHRKHHYKAHKRHHKAYKHHRKHKRHHFKKRYHRW